MKCCDLNYVPLFLPRPTSNWLSVAEKIPLFLNITVLMSYHIYLNVRTLKITVTINTVVFTCFHILITRKSSK